MDDTPNPRVILPAVLVSCVLIAGVFFAFQRSKNQKSTIVLPGGITYLGPTPTPTAPPTVNGKISVGEASQWVEHKGNLLPYAFSYPSSLSLGVFPDDPYDSVTVFYPGSDAQTNLFFRVDNLTRLNKNAYIGNLMGYAKNWWKDYTWKGVASMTTFTNSKGLNGVRAKYLDDKGESPYDHVFFSVPERTDLIIWVSGKLFTQDVFDRLVDSVSWKQ